MNSKNLPSAFTKADNTRDTSKTIDIYYKSIQTQIVTFTD
jgi:hypothetical protein